MSDSSYLEHHGDPPALVLRLSPSPVTGSPSDLERACQSLDDRQQVATIFNAPMTLFTADEVAEMLEGQGYTVVAHVGIRCICDYWGTTEEKLRPEVMAQIEALERRLMHRSPYHSR